MDYEKNTPYGMVKEFILKGRITFIEEEIEIMNRQLSLNVEAEYFEGTIRLVSKDQINKTKIITPFANPIGILALLQIFDDMIKKPEELAMAQIKYKEDNIYLSALRLMNNFIYEDNSDSGILSRTMSDNAYEKLYSRVKGDIENEKVS